MSEFVINGIKDISFSEDRSQFTIRFTTSGDTLVVKLDANHLDSLITSLQGAEYHASLIDPAKAAAGEAGLGRVEIVDAYSVGNGEINGHPSLIIRLGSAKVFRNFAIAKDLAQQLLGHMTIEIPNLKKQPKSH